MSVVVTENVGAVLPDLPYLQYYPAAQNDQIYSNDQTNAEWTATNVTVAQDETGVTGEPSTACTLTASAANGTVIANAITDAADDQATCWYLKRKTGTGNIDITLDNGSTWTTVTLTTSFQKFTVDQASLANPQIGIRIVTSGDAVICGNAEAYLGKVEAEVRGLGPIFTEASAVATDASLYQWDNANHSADNGTYYFEAYTDAPEALADRPSNNVPLLTTKNTADQIQISSTVGNAVRVRLNTTNRALTGLSWAGVDWKFGIVYGSSIANMSFNFNTTWANDYAAEDFAVTQPIKVAYNSAWPTKFRNLRRYDITSYQQGKDKIDELM